MRYRFLGWLCLGWILAAFPASAGDLALIVANESYRNLDRARSASDAMSAVKGLQDAGFEVISASDADGPGMAQAFGSFVAKAAQADRLIVVLEGNFVRSSFDSWLLPVDAPGTATLVTVPKGGIGLRQVYPVLAAHPGRAVLVAGWGGMSGSAGAYLAHGAVVSDLPQGVTGFFGNAADMSWFVQTALARPGIVLTDAAARLKGVSTAGYLPKDFILIGNDARPQPAPVPLPDADPQTERVFWDATRKADTVAAYEAYLRRYPNGPHAEDARRLAHEIRSEPDRAARLAEEDLRLSRDQRREIQRALTLLGNDTRGVDGIFGSGSRAAIAEWQTVNGFDATGYLTRDQIAMLARQAQVRSAELEKEAAAKRTEQERQDRAYWGATGAVGDEAGLRAYLDRYPDGIFARVAKERLDAIEAANRKKAAEQERAFWDHARERDNVGAYREYLERYPKGTFAEEAKARIRALNSDAEDAGQRAAAEGAEQALGLNQATRLLVEKRLSELGLDPGRVDGTFDADTRRALRRYQAARGLRATGYMDEATVVRLLADSFGGALLER